MAESLQGSEEHCSWQTSGRLCTCTQFNVRYSTITATSSFLEKRFSCAGPAAVNVTPLIAANYLQMANMLTSNVI